ncbi:DJ-1/PfpI family protein [Blastocladiella britannica]|nr:DJ-1/PfpI family protein [Blastocladiella britannica]
MTADAQAPTARTIGVLLYPGFAVLDVFGPVQYLSALGLHVPINFVMIAETMHPVSSAPPTRAAIEAATGKPYETDPSLPMSDHPAVAQRVCPDFTYETCPPLDVLLVPGGIDTRVEVTNQATLTFIRDRFEELEYLLTVCTGAAIVARTGLMDGVRVTSNKFEWQFVKAQGPKVDWVHRARWVDAGKIVSSSGVAAGMDMMYYWISKVYGADLARGVANVIEHMPATDADADPFAEVWIDRA